MYSGGSGTVLDPYLIATAQDFYNIRENLSAHFKQVSDIDFTNFGVFTAPDGDFTGIYNGGNFSVKNAEIKGGLFGTVSGSSALIQNVKLENASIESVGNDTGGIARRLENGVINFCRVIGGKITSNHKNTGGIVGYTLKAQVEFCWSDLLIESSSQNVGGIVGYVNGNRIANCYTLGDVISESSYVGGIAGVLTGNTGTTFRIENCYTVGYVYGQGGIGGICGHVYGYRPGREYYAEIRNCFALNKGIIRKPGSTSQDFGRIIGSSGILTRLINNHALENMKFYPDGFTE